MKMKQESLKSLKGCTDCRKPCKFNGMSASPDSRFAGDAKTKAELYGCNSRK